MRIGEDGQWTEDHKDHKKKGKVMDAINGEINLLTVTVATQGK